MSPEQRKAVRNGIQVARTGWRESWRELLWFLGALNDNGQPSAALFFAMAVGLAVIKHLWFDAHEHWDGWDVAMVGVVAAILFGSKMFMAWLNTKQVTATVAETVTVDAAKLAEISARRDRAQGAEPTP